jgi:hypothetical protein
MKKIFAPLLIASISLYGEGAVIEIHPASADESPSAVEAALPPTIVVEQENKIEEAPSLSLEIESIEPEKNSAIAEETKQPDELLLVETKEQNNAVETEQSIETAENLNTQPAIETNVESGIASEPVLEAAPSIAGPTPAVVSPAIQETLAGTTESTETEQQPQQIPSMVGKGSSQSANAARNRTWQNVAIAAGAVAIAVTALILVHNNRGHH